MLLAALPSFVDVDPARRTEACGEAPGNACRFVIEQTDNVGLAKLAGWLTGAPLKILLVVVGAFLLNRLVRRFIKRFAAKVEGSSSSGRLQRLRDRTPTVFMATGEVNLRSAARAETIAVVLRSICTGVIGAFAVMYVLSAVGLELGPLIAGAGVAGVALGFGAQSLVKDFISGIFMLIEDQYGVGDVVDIGEATGTVEQVTLRLTRLRDINGTVWHVPNGQISRVGNKSQQWARALLDVPVAPDADLERVAGIIGDAALGVWELDAARPDVLESPEVLGVEYLGPDAATIRVQGKTRPGAQWRVNRLLRVAIAEALDDAGVALPTAMYIRPGAGA